MISRIKLFLSLVWRKWRYYPDLDYIRIDIKTAWEVAGILRG